MGTLAEDPKTAILEREGKPSLCTAKVMPMSPVTNKCCLDYLHHSTTELFRDANPSKTPGKHVFGLKYSVLVLECTFVFSVVFL